jgi:hypothetical protein
MTVDKINQSGMTDVSRFAKSKKVTSFSANTYYLIRIPKYAFVVDVWAKVDTAFSTEDIEVGWSGNDETAVTNGFISSSNLAAGTTGLKRAIHDTAVTFPGKYFDTQGGCVTITFGTTATTGEMFIFVQYFVVQ